MIGTLLRNRYRIDAKLGEGGMGVVYRAHDSLLQRPVAIKTLSPAMFGAEGARRFLREAQSVAKLNHPHIVAIFDAVEEGGQVAIVMELVEGQTLRELLPLPVPRLIDMAIQVLQGLEYAHGQGIVHRDIKPENIIVTKEGTAKLMDFGLARSEGRSRLTQTGMVVGTVAYLAPEQALGGQVDGRSDLYALGAVLYEAVAGRPPFESEDPISVITQHINVPPVAPHWHNPAVPVALENVILKLLAKDPGRRYQSAREALHALTAVQATVAVRSTGTAAAVPVAEAEKLAGPELVQRLGRSPLVGREAELAKLKELVDQAITGRGAVALVTGPLGIGKTRLVEEVITYAHLRGVTVVSGNAYESAPPYEPFARALRDLARGVDSETLAARLGEFAPDVVGLIPALGRQLPRVADRAAGSPEDRKSRLLAGVAHFLESMTAQGPLLLFLDDMHFADAATSELLQHVARHAPASRVLLVVANRPDDVPPTPAGRLFGQVTHALGREGFTTTMPLHPLTEDHVIDLIQRLSDHPRRPVLFGRRMYEVTAGNPYYLEEVIKGLFEQGVLYIKDGKWSTDFDKDTDYADYSLLGVPTSVQAAVEARLRSLGDQTRQILTQAAVIGRQFSFDILQAVTATEEAVLLDRVEEALRAQLIREVRAAGEDVYEFVQPMVRQVLYDAIPGRRRRLLHRQVGEALEKVSARKPEPYLEALAMHFARAEEIEKTLRYARLAARKAADVFAHDDAAKYLQQAIAAAQELDRPRERLELMEELADLLFVAGGRERTTQAYEDAVQFWRSLPDGSVTDGARLYRKLGEIGTRWAHYNPRTREHIVEGLRLLDSTPNHPERVKLIIAKAFDLYFHRPESESDYPAAETTAQEAYRLAEMMGSFKDMSGAIDALAGIREQTADFPGMLQETQRLASVVQHLEDPLEHLNLHDMFSRSYYFLGQFAEALQHAEQMHELASRAGRPSYVTEAMSRKAEINARWNRWDEVQRWGRLYDATENRFGIRRRGRVFVLALRAMAAGVRGDLEEARKLEDELQTLPPYPAPGMAWGAPLVRLMAALAIGDHEKGRKVLEEGIRVADTPLAKLEFNTLALELASEVKEWRHIDELGADSLERARRGSAKHYVAQNCRALGIHRREHGRLDEADALLGEAEALFRALDCRWELGKTLRELALLRRAQERSDDAARLIQEALTHFEALGAVPDVERTRALM